MKKIAYLPFALYLRLFCSMSAAAQGAQPGTGKIGWIVTGAFGDDKEGIKTYVASEKALDGEMKPAATELQTLRTRIQTIADDLEKMQKACQNTTVPCDQRALAAKSKTVSVATIQTQTGRCQAKYAAVGNRSLTDRQRYLRLSTSTQSKKATPSSDVSAMIQGNQPSPSLCLKGRPTSQGVSLLQRPPGADRNDAARNRVRARIIITDEPVICFTGSSILIVSIRLNRMPVPISRHSGDTANVSLRLVIRYRARTANSYRGIKQVTQRTFSRAFSGEPGVRRRQIEHSRRSVR